MSYSPPSQPLLPYRLLAWGLLVAFTLRFSLSFLHPFSADEAHYALYGFHLDASYFDHPPLTGWLYAFMLNINEQEWVVRLLPNVFNLLTALGLFKLTKRLFPEQPFAAFWSVILYESSLLLNILSLGFIPDTPLVTLGVWASYYLYKIIEQPTWKNWLMLGALLGLMGLSKYTAILYALGAGIYLTIAGVEWWKTLKFYAALGLAIVLISPVLAWNMENDFISFLYQWEHGQVGESSVQIIPFFTSQLVQLVTYSPILFLGCWCLSLLGLIRSKYRLLSALNLITLGIFAYSSSKGGHYLPHWTALPMTLSLPFLIHWLLAKRWRIWLLKANVALNTLVCLAMALLLAGFFPTQLTQLALQDFNGWKLTSERAYHHAQSIPPHHRQLFVDNIWVASRHAWYAKPVPVIPLDQRFSQFSLWYGSPVVGSSGLLVLNTELPIEKRFNLEGLFRECRLLETVKESSFRGQSRFEIHHCQQLLPSDQY